MLLVLEAFARHPTSAGHARAAPVRYCSGERAFLVAKKLTVCYRCPDVLSCRSKGGHFHVSQQSDSGGPAGSRPGNPVHLRRPSGLQFHPGDRKSTRLNSSHSQISYAVFCLKKKKKK